MDSFFKPRQSLKPLGANNAVSSYDRKGLYGNLPKSPPGVRKTLFESRNKENDESMLCKDFTDREITGKSPVVIPQRILSGPNSDESEEKKIKPRRSMLGFRSKINGPSYSKDDSTFTLSKPLHSSSPLAADRHKGDENSEQRLQKATSTPTLSHPFDTEDGDTSSFFSKGLSDSTWSVFKSNKGSDKSKNYPNEKPHSTLASTNEQSRFHGGEKKITRNSVNWKARQSVAHSVDHKDSGSGITTEQKMKLEWLALKYKNNNASTGQEADNNVEKNMRKSFQSLVNASEKESEQQSTFRARTRAQAKKEREKHLYETITPVICESEEMVIDNNQDCNTSSEINTTFDSSADSYIQNEATIIGTCKKVTKTAEEDLSKLSISMKDEESNNDSEDHSEEYLSTHEEDPEPPSVNSLLNIINNLKCEKEELDSKFAAYFQQKDKYDKMWDHALTSINLFMNDIQKNSKSTSKITKTVKLSRKALNSKGTQSHTAPTNFVKPRESTKNFSGLKANFNCLKTPIQTSEKIKRVRKSVCYTPNSLSVLVGDQVKDIFGDM